MSKVTLAVSGEVGSGKSAVCDKVEQFLKLLGINVEWVGGAQERNLGICDIPKELTVEIIEQHSIDKIVNLEPDGFMMVHPHGPDRGFSWVQDDIQFSTDWKRVALFSEDQVADLHQRAVTAEARVAELTSPTYKVWGSSTIADLYSAIDDAHELSGPPHERIAELIRQRDEYREKCAVVNAEDDPAELWAEIHKLRAEVQGPTGHATWKDAAVAERTEAAKRILKWRDSFDAMHRRAMAAEKQLVEFENRDKIAAEQAVENFKEALHTQFNMHPIPTRLGIVAIMSEIEKVFQETKE